MPRSLRVAIAALSALIVVGPAVPSAMGGPSRSSGSDDWLVAVNSYRALGGLPPVTENPDWSQGDLDHSKYIVKTGDFGHDEDSSSIWSTAAGREAGLTGNVAGSSGTAYSDVDAVEDWLTGPFHGIGILDPQLTQSGFGSYREAGVSDFATAATLDVIRGLNGPAPTSPIMWPGDGSTLPLRSYGGGESPDPLTSCPVGYTEPTGPPLYLILTETPSVTDHNFSHEGTPLDSCVFDGNTYTNPDAATQDLGRNVLGGRNAVVLMPRQPLASGETYDVSITSNGQTYVWQFTAGGGGAGPSEVNRTISLTLKVGSNVVGKGTVEDDDTGVACETGVPVRLQYKKPSGWKNIASGTTDAEGEYKITTTIKVGRWRTKAVPTTVGDASCLKAVSSVWRVTS